ncbi:GntR family transcriptional regulator [Lichenifustis flavocetrariae]|uniref:GntR family transcriptional regulator n=1 Tax=Lichenifustis flavocetrariae TaxID=2949735 RepID=A0AA41Z895_9HYPH|nr:GntR family transcriptional regulator [Lichenifustis flavocetrariae]MCW6512160.1 GntR family transcriptional regulator [Lichenifustis flavocetrariae]
MTLPLQDLAPSLQSEGKPAAKKKVGKTLSLTEKIYGLIRTEILTCELEPGRELSEAELATRFDVSKTPVREALATLRSEGFVRTFPRRGYQVVPITFGDMSELFDLRTILEAGAAELACARITPAEIDQLNRLADVVYDRAEQKSLKRFIRANREFHAEIAKASGNERLHVLLVRQIDELERFFYLGARLRDVSSQTQSDHHAIVEVLKTRDPQAARQIMIRHNDITREGLFHALASSRSIGQITL